MNSKDEYETSQTNPKMGLDASSDTSWYIQLKVIGKDSNEIHFKEKMSAAMGKLNKSYSERVGARITSLRILFDGKRINDDEKPKSLEIEQDDVIEVYKNKLEVEIMMVKMN